MDPLTPPPAGAGVLIRWALGHERRSVITGAIVGTLWMASLAAIPVAVGAAIDRIADDASSDSVLPWALLVAAIVIGGALAGVIRHTIAVGLFSRTTWRVERLVSTIVADRSSTPDGCSHTPRRTPSASVRSPTSCVGEPVPW